MRFLLFLILYIFHSIAFSQSISKEVISSSGLNIENGVNSINFTIGETVVGSMTSEYYESQLGNGYYPSLNLEALDISIIELNIHAKIFPNPSMDYIYLLYPDNSKFDVKILDINGKLVLEGEYIKNQSIPIYNLSQGTYLVWITNQSNKQTNSYKILKK